MVGPSFMGPLGEGLLQQSLMKQLADRILAYSYSLTVGGFELLTFIWGEPRVI